MNVPPPPQRPPVWLPWLARSRSEGRAAWIADAVAGLVVAIMLVPQALAYALLAELPPQSGLYAGLLPPVFYALCGGSRVLAVGPVAVVSLMTAAAVGPLAASTGVAPGAVALALALAVGLISLAFAQLGLGALAQFLSHPVIQGLMSASALLIALGQTKHLLGVQVDGTTLPELLPGLLAQLDHVNALALGFGAAAIGLLLVAQRTLAPALQHLGLAPFAATLLARLAPVFVVVLSIALVRGFGLETALRTVGDIPRGLPAPTLPPADPALWRALMWPALLIAVIGFVESMAMAQTFAAPRRERIDPAQELRGLGLANLAAAFSGAYPVSGGLSRTVIAAAAGARSPLAGVLSAVALAPALLWATPLLGALPQAVLAATIVVPILKLVDPSGLLRLWRYSRADAAALVVTAAGVLLAGVERGLLAGVAVSIGAFLLQASRPHYAIVGRVPGTEHYRNVLRHPVAESLRVLTVRVDESLLFCNAAWLEDTVAHLVAERPSLADVVLLCSGVNRIDASAFESLERIDARLRAGGLRLHLSEVKGPVMDRLAAAGLPQRLSGQVFLSQHQAMQALDGDDRA